MNRLIGMSVLYAYLTLISNNLANGQSPSVSGPAFQLSLTDSWKEQPLWDESSHFEGVPAPGCRSWMNSVNMTALRICPGTNGFVGKSEAEVTKLFLEEPELGRTFLAEKSTSTSNDLARRSRVMTFPGLKAAL